MSDIFKTLFIFTIVLLTACDAKQTAKLESTVQLYVFECGVHKFKDISLFSPGIDEGVAKELTNSCYLIKHKNGNLLWDAGLPDEFGIKGKTLWDGGLQLSVKNPLMKQLEEINVKPQDINYIGISHFHFDHTGNANNFSNATLIIQKEEYDAAYGKEPEKYFFAPDTYKDLDKTKAKQLQGDLDLFADGSVIIKRALGHTPGHQLLVVNLKNEGTIVISGDLVHYTKNWENKRVPSFNFDKDKSLESMLMIEKYIKENNAQFWIQHDKEQNATIKHSPAYYD